MKTFLKWFFITVFVFDVLLAVMWYSASRENWNAGNSSYIPEGR